jgi:hypothetical protein
MNRAPSEFARGIGTGIALSAVLAHLWLAIELSHLADMYKDFQAPHLPALTRLTITPLWRWSVPAVGLVAVMSLVVVRPRAMWIYALAAAVLVGTVMGTWYFSQAPIFELAGEIK